ncbi:MAG: tetratricopeptide repeat protein, partial [Bacteroidia bacterium]
MKKLIWIAVLSLGFGAQLKAQERSVNSAEYSLASGSAEDLILAKEEIDKAAVNEKTFNNARMFLIKAMVYSRLFETKGNEMIEPLSAKSGFISGESMLAFFDNPAKKRYDDQEMAEIEVNRSFAAAFNESAVLYNDENYDGLTEYYELLLKLYDHLDTAMVGNLERSKITKKTMQETLAQVASLHSSSAKSMMVLQGLVDNGVVTPVVIETLSRVYQKNGDTASAEKAIRQALEATNYQNSIFQILVNLYVSQGREDDLMADVSAQIDRSNQAGNPSANMHYTRGYLLQENEQYDEAIADYRKAVELDPLHYDANFNLGVALMKYESRKLNDLPSADREPKRKALYGEAIEYLEVARENYDYSVSDQINLCRALMQCYQETDDNAKVSFYLGQSRLLQDVEIYNGSGIVYRILTD